MRSSAEWTVFSAGFESFKDNAYAFDFILWRQSLFYYFYVFDVLNIIIISMKLLSGL